MKSISFNLAFLLPLLLVAGPAFGERDPVLDVDGNPVTTQSTYYILPVRRGNGGGLSLGQRNATFSCPLYVTQEDQELERGLPARFRPVNSTEKVVMESTDMNVEFDASTVCVQSTVWTLGGAEGQKLFVRSGGVAGNPGRETLSNWFKIDKEDDFYKLVFCPTVCNTCRPRCGELGVLREDGKRFLGLAPELEPLLVMFKKVD